MARLTISLTDEQEEKVQELVSSGEYNSKNKAVQFLINRGERVPELEQEIERLKRERRQLLEQRSENKELQRYVNDEKRYREAGIVTRLKWFLRGMD